MASTAKTDEESETERTGLVPLGELLSYRQNETDKEQEEFIEVTKKSKRIFQGSFKYSKIKTRQDEIQTNCQVTMASSEPLPKQIALAKLLREMNIQGILSVKYTSSYKVSMYFDNEENAEHLIKCEQLLKKGFRCQRAGEMSVCYGVVRQVDKQTEEEELRKIFECDSEIISVRRLKKQTSDGTWADCETVRLSFRASTLPRYVVAYGCRFLVDPYTFPVSQCARCWSYSHIKKYCPIKNSLCPKCGGKHDNCEITHFKCVNCNGPHMSIEKNKCPTFKKEKDIRKLMCEEKCSYKAALTLYLDSQNDESLGSQYMTVNRDDSAKEINMKPTSDRSCSEVPAKNTNLQNQDEDLLSQNSECRIVNIDTTGANNKPSGSRSYSDVLKNKMNAQNQDKEDLPNQPSGNEAPILQSQENENQEKRKKKKKKRKVVDKEQSQDQEERSVNGRECDQNIRCIRLYNKMKDIVISRKLTNEKIIDCLSVIFDECYHLVKEFLKNKNCFSKFITVLRCL